MTPDQIVAAVSNLQAERDLLRDLLQDVADGYTKTSRDDVVLIQIPADTFGEIRARL